MERDDGGAAQIAAFLRRLTDFLRSLRLQGSHLTTTKSLIEKIEDKLIAINTAWRCLEHIDKHDKVAADPGHQNRRGILVREIQAVLTYCTGELREELSKLDFLAEQPEADKLKRIHEEIGDLVPRESVGAPVSQRQIRTVGMEPASTSYATEDRREVRTADTPAEPSVVPVNRRLVKQLRSHEEKLEDYIRGYLDCQERCRRCSDLRSQLEELPPQRMKRPFWERVGNILSDVNRMIVGLGSAFKTDPDLHGPIETLEAAVKEARSLVRDATSMSPQRDPDGTAAALTGCLDKARDAFEEIDTLCSAKARETVEELGKVINQIFGDIESQREAPEAHPTDRSGDYATKVQQQPMQADTLGRSLKVAPQAGSSPSTANYEGR